VPCQSTQLVRAQWQVFGDLAQRELDDEQGNDQPVQRLGDGSISVRGISRGHQVLENTAMRKFLIVLAALTCSCALPPKVVPPAAPPPVAAPSGPYERYEIVASRIEIRVFRDGSMAQFGHNHLISSDALGGIIELRNPEHDTRFTLELPLASLVVDDPATRSAAGAAFAKEVPQADRDATRRNLLGTAVLDATRQPVLRLTAESLEGGPSEFLARVRVGMRGEERIIAVPLSVQFGDGKISVHANFRLRHADLGLTPYTVALGALRVRDDFEIDCRIEARRSPPT
jgi:hypothetical protein